MTTIAVRNGIMAADTLAISDGYPHREQKLFRVGSEIIGLCGVVMDCQAFLEWYKAGANLEKTPEWKIYGSDDNPAFSALVLSESGVLYWSQHFQPTPVLDEFWAIGSGRIAALAVMHTGCSAEQAVRIAHKVDNKTGEEVMVEGLAAVRAA